MTSGVLSDWLRSAHSRLWRRAGPAPQGRDYCPRVRRWRRPSFRARLLGAGLSSSSQQTERQTLKLWQDFHPAGPRERDPSDATARGRPRRPLKPSPIAEWFRPPRRLRPRRHFVGPERAGASGAQWEGAQSAPLRTPRPRSCRPEVRRSLRQGEKPRSHVHQAGRA